MPVPDKKIVELVRRMLTFPGPTICRHSIAADLLNALDESGVKISYALANAVVNANDETALRELYVLETSLCAKTTKKASRS